MPFSPIRVRKCALSLRILAPQACPAPREASTVIKEVISLAFSAVQPKSCNMRGKSASNALALG